MLRDIAAERLVVVAEPSWRPDSPSVELASVEVAVIGREIAFETPMESEPAPIESFIVDVDNATFAGLYGLVEKISAPRVASHMSHAQTDHGAIGEIVYPDTGIIRRRRADRCRRDCCSEQAGYQIFPHANLPY